jgi:hypothetical protein
MIFSQRMVLGITKNEELTASELSIYRCMLLVVTGNGNFLA